MIGIIPIGGHATRMNGLPKFLLPVGDSFLLDILYQRMANAGATQIVIGVKASHRALVEQNVPDDALIYEVNTETMSQTVLAARPHIDMDQPVLFGMPDTYWTDDGLFLHLGKELSTTRNCIASTAIWLIPAHLRRKRGMCKIDHNRHLIQVVDKPLETQLAYGWGAMKWNPQFWQYINPYDPHVGFALQRAVDAGETIIANPFYGQYFDCGTPDEYYDCILQTERMTHATA